MRTIVSLILATLSLTVFSQHLDVEGHSKIRGNLDINHMDDSTSISIGRKSGINTVYGTARLNTFVGSYAGFGNTTGGENSFFGSSVGKANTTGYRNSFFGYNSGTTNTTGGDNSFFGNGAGQDNTEGIENAFFGRLSGLFNSTGSQNTFVGAYSGHSNTTGYENTAIGFRALYSNTISGEGGSGTGIVAIGVRAFENADSRAGTAVGGEALRFLVDGVDNTAIGGGALRSLTSGSYNTGLGGGALFRTTGTSSANVAVGHAAGEYSQGSHNTYVGYLSGSQVKQGHENTFLGNLAQGSDTAATNQIVIGSGSEGIKDNSAVIGNDLITDIYMAEDSGATVHAGKITLNQVTQVSNPTPGTIRWNGSDFQGWNGVTWISLTGGATVGELVDHQGNTYKTIVIGGQEWMAENLRVETFVAGTPIDQITSDGIWLGLSDPAWCYYDNNPSFNEPYGKLYNWFAVEGDSLCPNGWHIPSETDWNVLIDYLDPGMINPTIIGTQSTVAGGKMKETGHWDNPNTGATNSSGFSGVGTGFRNDLGAFDNMGAFGYWWSADNADPSNAFYRSLNYFYADADRGSSDFNNGYSVRCVRN